MKNNSAVIIIPARLNSSRFPKKILCPIDGKPLIVRVLEQAKDLDLCECYIACCCEEVKKIVENYGGKAIVTNPDLASGTDRVFAALEKLDNKPKFVVNLQGDTPVFSANIIPEILKVLENNESIDMTTPVVFKKPTEEEKNENVVKVVFNNMEKKEPGKAIYFSRAAIPHNASAFFFHIGIYAYRYEALKKFVSLPSSYLEETERLEQLRAIQDGMEVWAVPVDGFALEVNVENDLKPVLKAISD
ncbi:MAG: 3-deoxy-manno-octulosonate cytidylyltransferase [Holosporales bacterium]|jgi:3-deoxy-manno-octulosonate cytidylyltransferase (CMP-KDO synthetase)|nr:3-deoxy-manno-octulosonate cytidylyltransferase [Holosporales bacterium]